MSLAPRLRNRTLPQSQKASALAMPTLWSFMLSTFWFFSKFYLSGCCYSSIRPLTSLLTDALSFPRQKLTAAYSSETCHWPSGIATWGQASSLCSLSTECLARWHERPMPWVKVGLCVMLQCFTLGSDPSWFRAETSFLQISYLTSLTSLLLTALL